MLFRQRTFLRMKRKTSYNTGFASGGLTCKLGTLCFYSSLVQVDSFVLRNPPERKARKRCAKLLAHFTTKSVRKQQRQNRNDFVIELCKWDLRKRILSSESLEKFDEVTRKKWQSQVFVFVCCSSAISGIGFEYFANRGFTKYSKPAFLYVTCLES